MARVRVDVGFDVLGKCDGGKRWRERRILWHGAKSACSTNTRHAAVNVLLQAVANNLRGSGEWRYGKGLVCVTSSRQMLIYYLR